MHHIGDVDGQQVKESTDKDCESIKLIIRSQFIKLKVNRISRT